MTFFFRVDFLNVTPFFIDGLTIIILIIFKPKVVSCMSIQCVCPFCLSVFQWQTCENAFQRCSTWAIFCWLDKNYKNYLNRPLSEENISAGMWTWKLARAPINPLFVLFLVLLFSYTLQTYSVVVQCKHKNTILFVGPYPLLVWLLPVSGSVSVSSCHPC